MDGPDDLVTVITAGNPGTLALAQSILKDAGIPFSTTSESFQWLYAAGSVGIVVAREQAEKARELLAGL